MFASVLKTAVTAALLFGGAIAQNAEAAYSPGAVMVASEDAVANNLIHLLDKLAESNGRKLLQKGSLKERRARRKRHQQKKAEREANRAKKRQARREARRAQRRAQRRAARAQARAKQDEAKAREDAEAAEAALAAEAAELKAAEAELAAASAELAAGNINQPQHLTSSVTGEPLEETQKTASDGKFPVCLPGGKSKKFGLWSGDRPMGVKVEKNGDDYKCIVAEYAGGFDGYYSAEAGDGHEDEFKEAVNLMLGGHGIVGKVAGRRNPKNYKLNKFLKKMKDMAKPIDMDWPRDKELAKNGARMDNINKISDACTKLITVVTDC